MPKAKPNKAAKSRFKITGTGKVMRRSQGRRHILTKKTSDRKRRLGTPKLVAETVASTIKKMMIGF